MLLESMSTNKQKKLIFKIIFNNLTILKEVLLVVILILSKSVFFIKVAKTLFFELVYNL
jgi:hypothetical protein